MVSPYVFFKKTFHNVAINNKNYLYKKLFEERNRWRNTS